MSRVVLLAHEISDARATRTGPYARIRLSREDLRRGLEYHTKRHHTVTLTLDDGYATNIDYVVELVERYRAHLVLFLTTGFINGSLVPYELQLAHLLRERGQETYEQLRNPLRAASHPRRLKQVARLAVRLGNEVPSPPSGLFLDWDRVRTLDAHPLVSIGAHTVNHLLLNRRAPRTVWREVVESKKEIEAHLGHRVESFAYPYGATSPLVTSLVKLAGFSQAYVTGPGKPSPLQIGRIDLNGAH